jgi:hypothetical protein
MNASERKCFISKDYGAFGITKTLSDFCRHIL